VLIGLSSMTFFRDARFIGNIPLTEFFISTASMK
jgi:hypothetical protein